MTSQAILSNFFKEQWIQTQYLQSSHKIIKAKNLTEIAAVWVQRRQKAGFLSSISYKITLTKEKKGEKETARRKKRGEEKKTMVTLLVFILATLKIAFGQKKKTVGRKKKKNGSFGDNIVKNPARRLYEMRSIDVRWPETSFTTSKWHTLKDWQDSWKHINPFFPKK